MDIKVTIGVCVRNCANYIREVVDRICTIDFPLEKMEVVFVEDGSQDNTPSEILKHTSRLKTKYAVHSYGPIWKGLGFARNVVLKNARGEYIVWIDDGTILSKTYVKEHVDFMDKHPAVGIAQGSVDPYIGSNLFAILENAALLVLAHQYGGKPTRKLLGAFGSVYRVEAARQVGGFDENIKGAGEDMDIEYRILKSGWKIFKTSIPYTIVYNEQLIKIWKKNVWYGYGQHQILHKHKALSDHPYKSTPMAGFLQGILISLMAYKLTFKKIVFFLPIFFSIKRTAYCLGFIRGHFDAYKNRKE
jgi:glycosyltransferase involved in cell wall biosynthesis